ncbi:MAG: DUF3168 domain-containing protein [Pseudomonadota bacterium]
MPSASLDLQRAIYDRLTGALADLQPVTAVYDHVPGDARLPYIVIGDDQVTDWSTKSFFGFDHRLTLHMWARTEGRATIKSTLTAISDTLCDPKLELGGHHLVHLRHVFSDVIFESESDLYHGVARLAARTAPFND